MIKQKVPKVVTVGIDAGFLAQACWTEEWKRLKRLQGRLALGYCYSTAGNCGYKENFLCFDSKLILRVTDASGISNFLV